MRGLFVFLLVVFVVWVGGCSISSHFSQEREEIYGEVWDTAPDLKRVHTNVSAELVRLSSLREELNRRKSLFETEDAKRAADSKIEVVNQQMSRLESSRVAIMTAVEKQSLTNLSTKVENPLQREMVAILEYSASEAVKDAVDLRVAIESGVSADVGSWEGEPSSRVVKRVAPPSPASANDRRSKEPENRGPNPSVPGKSSQSGVASNEMRTWRDLNGHSVSARLIAVMDDRGNALRTLGGDPEELYRSNITVHLQRIDGKIVIVPIGRLSGSDVVFLTKGR